MQGDIERSEMMETVKAKFCSQCGNRLPANVVFCPACGGKLKNDDPGVVLEAQIVDQEYGEKDECATKVPDEVDASDVSGSQTTKGEELFGFLKKLLWTGVALEALVELSEIANDVSFRHIVTSILSLWLSIWLASSVCSKKNWARVANIVFTIGGVIGMVLCGVLLTLDSLLDEVSIYELLAFAVSISCTVILFNKHVKGLFKQHPDTVSDKYMRTFFWILCTIYVVTRLLAASTTPEQQLSEEDSQEEAEESLEEAEKDFITCLDEAAAGSLTAKQRQELIEGIMGNLAEDRDNATDDGKTDKTVVEMAAKALLDDYILAYKKILGKQGNKKYISFDDIKSELPEPPLSVSVRVGMLSVYVVQVRNESDRTKHVRVFIYNGNNYDSIVGKHIKPAETEDFGYLEFENDWKPKAGDKGFVRVSGYNALLYFELLEDARFRTGICRILPSDCPLKLKKEFLSAIQ